MSLGIVPLKLPYTPTQSSNAVLRLALQIHPRAGINI